MVTSENRIRKTIGLSIYYEVFIFAVFPWGERFCFASRRLNVCTFTAQWTYIGLKYAVKLDFFNSALVAATPPQ